LRFPWPAPLAAIAAACVLAGARPVAAEDPRAPVFFVDGLPASSGLRALLLEEAPRICAEARDWFHADVDGPITLAWAADAEHVATWAGGDPGPVAGLALPSRRAVVLVASALQSRPDRIVSVLRHELCHLYFAAATAEAEVEPPRWLNEGVAMWWSGDWDLGLDYRRDQASLLRDANAAGSLMPFRDLDGSFPRGPFFHVAYAQSQSFVDWMVKRGSAESLQRLIARLNADEDPTPAFEAVYGISLEDAETAWRKGLGGGFGRLPSATVLINAAWALLGLAVFVRWIVVRARMRRLPEDPNAPRWPEAPPHHRSVGGAPPDAPERRRGEDAP